LQKQEKNTLEKEKTNSQDEYHQAQSNSSHWSGKKISRYGKRRKEITQCEKGPWGKVAWDVADATFTGKQYT